MSKTWGEYVEEAEQYKHYKQRCEQLEAALLALIERDLALAQAITRTMQRCEQLEAENARLREALETICDIGESRDVHVAREALAAEGDQP
jgi:hypothetical protein